MASRERRAKGRSSETDRAPAGAADTVGSANHATPTSGPSLPENWDDYFYALSPAQRAELFSLARQQGLLHAHQLPVSLNGTAPAAKPWPSEQLGRIIDGETEQIEPNRPAAVAVHDDALDESQRLAVTRAVTTTDICLINGPAGTGKSRVVVEILRQLAERGERVLLLAHHAVSIDRILELVQPHEAVFAVRLLSSGEHVDRLPAAARAATYDARLNALRARTVSDARKACEIRERECSRLRQETAAWDQLEDIAKRTADLNSQIDDLARERALISDCVEMDAADAAAITPSLLRSAIAEFARHRDDRVDEIERFLTEKHEQIAACRQDEEKLTQKIEELGILADRLHTNRWWAPSWWQARGQRKKLDALPDLTAQLSHVNKNIAEAELIVEQLVQARVEAIEDYKVRLRQRVSAEIDRRQAAHDDQLSAWRREGELLDARWQAACAPLGDGNHPAEQRRTTVESARMAWQNKLDLADREHLVLKQWLKSLTESDPWSTRFWDCVNVVSAPTGSLDCSSTTDRLKADRFNTLVLQDAERFTETQFAHLASHADRCIIIGDTSRSVAGSLFERIWRRLHWDPTRLPYTWMREADRLCCRLRHVAPEQRKHLENESVADFPEIELRILNLPRSQPMLVEVIFPASMALPDAKRYIYTELDELAVETVPHAAHWRYETNRIVFQLGDGQTPAGMEVVLEPGIRELLCARPGFEGATGDGVPWRSHRFEFSSDHGWNRERAEAWVHQRLGAHDLGRTAHLTTDHRFHPGMSAFIHSVLGGVAYRIPLVGFANGCASNVKFVPVPSLGNSTPVRKNSVVSRRGGAGLEIDLSDARQRPRLPADLLARLPSRGFVNYVEAQAIVQYLQTSTTAESAAKAVTVLALYRAQVDLLRMLIERCATLAPVEVRVETPADFRECESSVVLLGLTRSHSTRAVTFGDGPEELAVSLTRARSSLVIFGDAGSLTRRIQWDGPLEHLDSAAASRERELLTRTVQYIEGGDAGAAGYGVREVVGT